MLRTNAPRMVTVVVAVALTIVGLALSVFDTSAIVDPVMEWVVDAGWDLTQDEAGWAALLASPLLLAAGSFLKGW